MYSKIFKAIIKRTLTIPIVSIIPVKGYNNSIILQLDSALMLVGFKLSKRSIEYLSSLSDGDMIENSYNILTAVKELVGDNVKHNVYFIDFPNNIPNTLDFWVKCINDALLSTPEVAENIRQQLQEGVVNLLDLPKYGKYQHTYEELVAAHEQLIPAVENNIKILHLGDPIQKEAEKLYRCIAESKIPLNDADKELLNYLADIYTRCSPPLAIQMRENKAIINVVRINNGHQVMADTPTDILRLACLLSDGDVTLSTNTKFKSFPRSMRRAIMQALESIIKQSPDKLGDVNQYCEQWKRLGERLHIHEYNKTPNAQNVFATARKDKKVLSIASKIEKSFLNGNINESISLLSHFPGLLFRNLDRVVRLSSSKDIDFLIETIEKVIPKISGRVILSVREHLQNRLTKIDKRVFINQKSTPWVMDDNRPALDQKSIERIFYVCDKELYNRIQPIKNLVVDKNILKTAIPLSDKGKSDGFAIRPRGSVMPVSGEILRFFIYWKQKSKRTDYDLSAIMLDEKFKSIDHLSYTNLKSDGKIRGVHSGDITGAKNGASEFIDVYLNTTDCKYIIPSINLFSGENFMEVEKCFFGFMQRTKKQMGLPFEPSTVKTKSDVRGKGKVALPLVFIKTDNDGWVAKWLNVYLNGTPNMNRVEENKADTSLLVKSVIEHDYLCISYLIALLHDKSESFCWYEGQEIKENTMFIGIDVPENLPDNVEVFTLNNLQSLLPV